MKPLSSSPSAAAGGFSDDAALVGTGIGTALRDLLTGERFWDSTMKSIFGLPADGPTPSRDEYLQLIVDEDRERVAAAQLEQAAAGQYRELSYRIRTPAGELRDILSRSMVQFDESGRAQRVVITAIDLTASRRHVEELQRIHQRLRLATEISGVGSWERDLDTGAGRWDATLFALFGLPPADTAPTRDEMLQRVLPGDRALVEAAWHEVAANQGAFEYAYRIVRPDGSELHVVTRARALPASAGRPRRAIGTTIDVTAAHRAARERAELLTRLQLANSTAGIGVWERCLADNREIWDERMREMHGIDSSFSPSLDVWLRMVIAEQRGRVAAREGALAAGSRSGYECTIVRPDGELRTIARNAVVIFDEADAKERLLGTAIDVTDIRRAQHERDELAERMRLVAGAVGLGVWDWDLLAETSVWNEQMYALFGRTREQFRPLIWLDVVHPDDVTMARSAMKTALERGATFELEFRTLLPDGSTRWIASRGRVERDSVGNAVRMIGVNWDVTHRHESETRLRDAVDRLRLTTASTGIGLWTIDLASGHIEWDAQMRRLYGGADDTADPARLWIDMTHPDEPQTVLAAAMGAAQRNEPLDIDLRIVCADGRTRTIAHRAQIQGDETGTPIRQLGVCWDITERKLAEEALRDKEAAERASQSKSEFLSRVSHELRTPLNAILGFAQILDIDRSSPPTAVQRERLAHIMTAGRHLLALINDVLDLSRIEAGADKLSMQPAELAPVIEACLTLVAGQAAAQGVAVHAAGTVNVPKAWVDATRLQQVLLNLLSNAIKYNRRGGEVHVSVELPQPGRVAIRVADTGAGMTAEQLAQLFQPFNRLGRETQPIPGAGIGLAISQRLVEQMGGSLSAQSEFGRGTEFVVLLRAAAAAGAAPSSTGLADVAHAAVPRSDVGGCVLYVEDVDSNRSLVEALMTMRPGVRLLLAGSGEEALRLAAREAPDLLLIDINLPDMSGTELLRRLRSLPQFRETPCVAVSANALAHEIEQAIAAGFNDYWTKPLQAARFLRGIDNLLGGG